MPQKLQTAQQRLKEFFKKCEDKHLSLERIIAAALASLMFSYIYALIGNGDFSSYQEYYLNINFGMFFTVALLSLGVLIVATYLSKCRYIIPWALIAGTAAVSVLIAANYPSSEIVPATSYYSDTEAWVAANISYVFFAVGIGVFDFIVVKWLVKDDKLGLSGITIDRRITLITACALFVIATVVFGYFTSLKYRSFNNHAFDFGIFAQMYERMAVSGAPETTLERSYLMSHFGVHFSPIFYLFLPGYWIFRSPIYLFYLQAAAVAAGVFAVYLIAGKLGLSGKMTLALELIYIFYPCLLNGTFYDFHENKFLTTIILFLFYFIVSKKTALTFVFSLLLLMVKEDAAIYLICIALFVMIYRKEVLKGVGMLAMALVYFVVANKVVASVGTEGVMMDRLSDYFLNGEKTYGSVLKTIFYDLGYVIKQMFKADKLPFVLWMFAPVLFAPFMTKKVSALILLLPILPINIMQSWIYQSDVDFQYTYGVAAMIFMSLVFVVLDLKTDRKRLVVMTSVILCMVMSTALVYPKLKHNDALYQSAKKTYSEETVEKMEELCASVPADASVTASSSVSPHLYRVKHLYIIMHTYDSLREEGIKNGLAVGTDTDYYVLDTRYDTTELKTQMADNYSMQDSAGFIEVYKRR
ncbi:MAG: DUF2079 domain-containing protein [Ruminococcus sp.]|nr:DUF2079 domain-containing protein [Ruminococcus sp.]